MQVNILVGLNRYTEFAGEEISIFQEEKQLPYPSARTPQLFYFWICPNTVTPISLS
jgi:hypothetical protein